MKRIIHFTLLIVLLNVCFLFSPKPTSETIFWGEYIPIGTHAGFINNFDSREFVESAIDPSVLMRKGYVRQSRPLYAVTASIIGYGIYYTSGIFKNIYELSLTKSIYIGYVCLNFITLLLALCLFEKIALVVTDGKIPYIVILTLSVFIASNFMTKAFFWTAHQQMLAFLTPLLSIYITMFFIKDMPAKRLCIIFFLFGVGMLAYGSFLVLFTVCMLYLCYTLYVKKSLVTFRSFTLLTICCLLFVIPSIGWVLFLKYKGVTYYSHEVVQYRQLVWIADALSISIINLLSVFYSNLLLFLPTLLKLCLFVAFFLIIVISRKIKIGRAFYFDINTRLIVLNLIFFTCFIMILGYYANRITFTLMPIILCLSIANAGEVLNNKNNQIALVIIATIWHTINVFSYGPFS